MLRDQELARIYRRSKGPVALCDESYRLSPGDEMGFYTTTGVLFDRARMDAARAEFVAIAGPRGWHTTEEFEAGRERRIHQMLQSVIANAEWTIVSVAAPVADNSHGSAQAARRACLQVLWPELTRGSNPPQVIVMDTRGDEKADSADRRLAAELRGRRQLPAQTLVRHADDKHEPLLGAADAVGWAVRRLLARDEVQWWADVEDAVTVVHTETGRPVRLTMPQKHNSAKPAAARSAPDGSMGLPSAETDRRTPSLLSTPVSHREPASGNPTQEALRHLIDQAFPRSAQSALDASVQRPPATKSTTRPPHEPDRSR